MHGKWITGVVALSLLWMAGLPRECGAARLKDVASIEGVRDNQLVGFGLVYGLNDTGDNANSSLYTIQAHLSVLAKEYGITVPTASVRVKNVAAVMVTAQLPAFSRPGSRFDVTVSSIGDAESLEGGVLFHVPLSGADGQVYAVAMGPVTVGGFSRGAGGNQVTQNHVTVGRVPNGAYVERAVAYDDVLERPTLNILLFQADFTTAQQARDAIAHELGVPQAVQALDAGTIQIDRSLLPERFNNIVDLVAAIERVDVNVDVRAKVVINERTGTVVMGQDVRIATVAVQHGGLTLTVSRTPYVSQPGPFARRGRTVETEEVDVTVTERPADFHMLEEGGTLGELITALNQLGVTARDMISIVQTLKECGALKAELVLM